MLGVKFDFGGASNIIRNYTSIALRDGELHGTVTGIEMVDELCSKILSCDYGIVFAANYS